MSPTLRGQAPSRPLSVRLGVVAILSIAGAAYGHSDRRANSASHSGMRTTGLGRTSVQTATTGALRAPVFDLTRQARLRRAGQVLPGDAVAAYAPFPPASEDAPADTIAAAETRATAHAELPAPGTLPSSAAEFESMEAEQPTTAADDEFSVESHTDYGPLDTYGTEPMPAEPGTDRVDNPANGPSLALDEPMIGYTDSSSFEQTDAIDAVDEPVNTWRVSESVIVTDLGVGGMPPDVADPDQAIAHAAAPGESTRSWPTDEPIAPSPPTEADRPKVIALRDPAPDELLIGSTTPPASTDADPVVTPIEPAAIDNRSPLVVIETSPAPTPTEAPSVAPQAQSQAVAAPALDLPVATMASAAQPSATTTAELNERSLVARPEAYTSARTTNDDGASGIKPALVDLDPNAPAKPSATKPAPALQLSPPSRPIVEPTPAVREPVVSPAGTSPAPSAGPVSGPTGAAARPATPGAAPASVRPSPRDPGNAWPMVDPAFPVAPLREPVIDLAGPGDFQLTLPQEPVLADLAPTEEPAREPLFDPAAGLGDTPTAPGLDLANIPPSGIDPAAAPFTIQLVEGAINNIQWRTTTLEGHNVAMGSESGWSTPRIGESLTGVVEIRTGVGAALHVRLDDRTLLEVDRMTRVTLSPGGVNQFGTSPARVELGRGRVRVLAADPSAAPVATIITPDQTFDVQSASTIDYSAFVGSRRSDAEPTP